MSIPNNNFIYPSPLNYKNSWKYDCLKNESVVLTQTKWFKINERHFDFYLIWIPNFNMI